MTALWIKDFDEHPEIAHSVITTSVLNYNQLALKLGEKDDHEGVQLIYELNSSLTKLAKHIRDNYKPNESSHPAL